MTYEAACRALVSLEGRWAAPGTLDTLLAPMRLWTQLQVGAALWVVRMVPISRAEAGVLRCTLTEAEGMAGVPGAADGGGEGRVYVWRASRACAQAQFDPATRARIQGLTEEESGWSRQSKKRNTGA